MPTTQPDLKPNRRGLWLAVAVVVALLALASWVVLHNFDRSSPAALRRAAFDGDQATVRRLITAHPEWIDSVVPTNGLAQMFSGLYDKAMKAVGKPRPSSFGNPEREFREQEGLGGEDFTVLCFGREAPRHGHALARSWCKRSIKAPERLSARLHGYLDGRHQPSGALRSAWRKAE